MDTHTDLLAPMCNSIPIFDGLRPRNCNFINSCLTRDSFLVRSVAVYDVYLCRMSSPSVRNAQFCCERFNFSLSYFSQLVYKLINIKIMASLPDVRKSIAGLACELCFLCDGSSLSASFILYN